MTDFEGQVLDLLKQCNDKFSGLLVLFGLLFVICCVALLIWSFCYDKKEAEKREKELKEYIDEEIQNAKK